MNEADVYSLLHRLGCMNPQRRGNGWVEASCPFAPYTHKSARDVQRSFGVKVSNDGSAFYRCHACNNKGNLRWLPKALGAYRNVDSVAGFIAEKTAPSADSLARKLRESAEAGDAASYVEVGSMWIPASALPPGYVVNPALEEKVLDEFPPLHKEAAAYLEKRGIGPEQQSTWGLRWNHKAQRILIPIRDVDGRLVAYSGRAWAADQKPKFLHSRGFQRDLYLFGEYHARKGGTVHVVEGFFDAMVLQSWGYAAVAALGVFLSKVHVVKLSRLWSRAVLVFDGDKAGYEQAGPALTLLQQHMTARGVTLPQGKDPDDLTPEERVAYLGATE